MDPLKVVVVGCGPVGLTLANLLGVYGVCTIALERIVGQSGDHPEVVTIPETGYLKGALLRAVD